MTNFSLPLIWVKSHFHQCMWDQHVDLSVQRTPPPPPKEVGRGGLREVLPSRHEVCRGLAPTPLNGNLAEDINGSASEWNLHAQSCLQTFGSVGLARSQAWAALSCLPLLTVYLLCRNKQWPKIAAQQNQRSGVRQQVTRGNCTNLSPRETSSNMGCATSKIEANALFWSCFVQEIPELVPAGTGILTRAPGQTQM